MFHYEIFYQRFAESPYPQMAGTLAYSEQGGFDGVEKCRLAMEKEIRSLAVSGGSVCIARVIDEKGHIIKQCTGEC